MSKSPYSVLDDIPSGLNQNLTSPCSSFYMQLIGEPRLDRVYSEDPSDATNPILLKLCKTENVGPFRATGLKPAVDSLKEVMSEIALKYPDLINRLNNGGMRVVRYVSGTTTLSNHSWGAAIDLKVDNIEDKRRDEKILHGLALAAPIFNKHKWYSGAGYKHKINKKTGKLTSNEDAMHFEVSKEKLLEWQKAGLFGPVSKQRTEVVASEVSKSSHVSSTSMDHSRFELRKGDKGPKVEILQNSLRAHNYNIISDGRFGSKTEAALKDFQRKHDLTPNGVAGIKTSLYLALF